MSKENRKAYEATATRHIKMIPQQSYLFFQKRHRGGLGQVEALSQSHSKNGLF